MKLFNRHKEGNKQADMMKALSTVICSLTACLALQAQTVRKQVVENGGTGPFKSEVVSDVSCEGFGGNRPCHYEWIKRVSDDCQKYRVNFTVDAIGSHFVKDGKMYHLDSQELQGKQAYRSGLSHFFSKPKYMLYHPIDGHMLEEGELMVPRFNVHRCLECVRVQQCIGCTDCGSCKQVELVSMEQLMEMRDKH